MGDLDVRADLFEIMYTCRAMRRLKPDPVGEDTLVKLIDAAIQAPTAADARTWRFIVVRDPNIKEQIGREWRRGWSWYLEMPRSLNLAALVPVGYPKGKFGPTARPHPRDVISWDRYPAS